VNFTDNTVTPIRVSSNTVGPAIPVGGGPNSGAITPDASGAEQASARSQKHRFDFLTVPSLPVDATETPVIMQGLERPKKDIEHRRHGRKEVKEAKRPVHVPRGSASLVPAGPSSLPRTPSLSPSPAVTLYNPPSINSPSDRVIQLGPIGKTPVTAEAMRRLRPSSSLLQVEAAPFTRTPTSPCPRTT
jgi:hypothetical protein